MAIKDPKELFVAVLSHVLQGTERSAVIYKGFGELAQNPEIQQALAACAFVAMQTLEKLDQAFNMIGEKPVNVAERLHDVFVEDFRRELAEIQSPQARRLFVLAKANHLSHMRTAEFVTLVAATFRQLWRWRPARELPCRPLSLRGAGAELDSRPAHAEGAGRGRNQPRGSGRSADKQLRASPEQ